MKLRINNEGSHHLLALLVFSLLLISSQCRPTRISKIDTSYVNGDHRLPYLLNSPDRTIKLSKKLKEISGLEYYEEEDALLAVNDEKGEIFILDKETGEIKKEIEFEDDADYEGITAVGNIAYVTLSKGSVEVVDLNSGENTDRLKTDLDRKNDVEGILYHKEMDRLLLFCKGRGLDKKKSNRDRFIYSLDIKEEKLDDEPYFTFSLREDIQELEPYNITEHWVNNLSVTSRIRDFGPSGAAFHPHTGDIYVVSSRGSILVVLSPEKEIKGIHFFRKSINGQPEGLAFDPDGTLYLSNETHGKRAHISVYTMQEIEIEKNDSVPVNPLEEVIKEKLGGEK